MLFGAVCTMVAVCYSWNHRRGGEFSRRDGVLVHDSNVCHVVGLSQHSDGDVARINLPAKAFHIDSYRCRPGLPRRAHCAGYR